jgi:general secretion pathway protein G
LIIVISIIAILLSVAIPTYSRSILGARERALRSDLTELREAIWKYTLDKQKAPQSLDDLRAANYIDKIPDDPMTHEPNWEVAQEDVLLSVEQQDPGIVDVHSASNNTASDGTAYSSW